MKNTSKIEKLKELADEMADAKKNIVEGFADGLKSIIGEWEQKLRTLAKE